MVSISSFTSSSIQHDVHFVNYGPIEAKYVIKQGMFYGITGRPSGSQSGLVRTEM